MIPSSCASPLDLNLLLATDSRRPLSEMSSSADFAARLHLILSQPISPNASDSELKAKTEKLAAVLVGVDIISEGCPH